MLEVEIFDVDRTLVDSVDSHARAWQDAFAEFGLAALVRLGKPPRGGVMVIGGAPYDAITASKAGLCITGVRGGGFPDESLRDAGCIAVYDDPAELLAQFERWAA